MILQKYPSHNSGEKERFNVLLSYPSQKRKSTKIVQIENKSSFCHLKERTSGMKKKRIKGNGDAKRSGNSVAI